jgi:tetratricopeptide (TPR) repeat protein
MRGAAWYTLATVVVAGGGGIALLGGSGSRNDAPAANGSTRDLDIQFYEARVRRDPRSARDFAELAALYLQRSRETADDRDLSRAAEHAGRSVELRTGRNAMAFGVLASSLLAQHRFGEAAAAARRLIVEDSTSIAGRALLAETQVELGRYDEAGRTLGSLATYSADLSVAPRLARWHELHGRPEQARRLLRMARDEAARRHGMPREQLAWFHLRLGDLALRHGRLGEAERELRGGLVVAPRDHRLLGTLARLEAVRHRWKKAIAYGAQAIGQALDPATLGVVGEAYAASGDLGKAEEYYRTLELVVLQQPGAFHRAWSLFLLDHNWGVSRVLRKAQEELDTRRDVYGYDLVAWALHKSGRNWEAREVMARALGLGTRDAMLFYHAGMIERALGNDRRSRRYLEAALETNRYWHPFQPERARAVLNSLNDRR